MLKFDGASETVPAALLLTLPVSPSNRPSHDPSRMLLRLLTVALFLLGTAALRGADYRWDFRTEHFDNLSLVPLGPGAVNLLRPTPRGLQISLPVGKPAAFIGFSPRFKVRGDFDISMSFEIEQVTTPESGHGSGVSIYLTTESPGQPAANLGRLRRIGGKNVFNTFTANVVEDRRQTAVKLFDTTAESGTLCIRRIGPEVVYMISEGSDPSRELVSTPFDTADVILIRFGVNQSDPQSFVRAYVQEISISADELPHLPSEQDRTAQLYRPAYQLPPKPPDRTWIWSLVAAGLIGAAGGVWIMRRLRRQRSG